VSQGPTVTGPAVLFSKFPQAVLVALFSSTKKLNNVNSNKLVLTLILLPPKVNSSVEQTHFGVVNAAIEWRKADTYAGVFLNRDHLAPQEQRTEAGKGAG
jgi:hypothetical protein